MEEKTLQLIGVLVEDQKAQGSNHISAHQPECSLWLTSVFQLQNTEIQPRSAVFHGGWELQTLRPRTFYNLLPAGLNNVFSMLAATLRTELSWVPNNKEVVSCGLAVCGHLSRRALYKMPGNIKKLVFLLQERTKSVCFLFPRPLSDHGSRCCRCHTCCTWFLF